MTTPNNATPPAATDYQRVRANRYAALTDDERQLYDQAYQDAGRAMDLAELVYTTRTDAGLTQIQLPPPWAPANPPSPPGKTVPAPPASTPSNGSPKPAENASTSPSPPHNRSEIRTRATQKIPVPSERRWS